MQFSIWADIVLLQCRLIIKGKKMENTPSRIAADILIAAIETKQIYVESAAEITAAFNDIHTTVHEAAKKDYQANLFNVFNR